MFRVTFVQPGLFLVLQMHREATLMWIRWISFRLWEKYCKKFQNLKQTAHPIVLEWIEKTTVCLKLVVFKFVQQNSQNQTKPDVKNANRISCQDLRQAAFQAHPICYTESGYCELYQKLGFVESLKFIFQMINILQIKDILSFLGLKQIYSIRRICGKWREVSEQQSVL